jgi:hypothetical protein
MYVLLVLLAAVCRGLPLPHVLYDEAVVVTRTSE